MMEAGNSGLVHDYSKRVVEDPNADDETRATAQALEAAMLGHWGEAEEVLRRALEQESDNPVVSVLNIFSLNFNATSRV